MGMRLFWKLLADRRGATAVEYALICALIVLACMFAISAVADSTIGMWDGVSNNMSGSM
jgi:pilus assembly protein Flp/PilA